MKLISLIISAMALGYLCFSAFAPGPQSEPATVMIQPGSGFRGAVASLESAQMLRSATGFYALAIASGQARKFKAGEYLIPPHASAWQIIGMLAAGKVVVHRFTLPEGWTVKETLSALASVSELAGDAPNGIEEGALLPETYQFTRGDSRTEMVKRMQKAMRDTLRGAWDTRDPAVPLKDAREALILASLVEEETGVSGERERIAAVFYNRIRAGMKLQTDPTVLYGLGRSARTDRRGLSSKDLQSDTPYNTYIIEGLPPGPIACPGKATIHAVLHPAQSDELFFVADGKGGHRFASDLAGHNANVGAYRNRSIKDK